MPYHSILIADPTGRKFSSVQFGRSVMSDSLWPHELQHARPPCPSPTPGVHPNPCPSSPWCHPTISSSVVPFSSCPQSFPASGSFQMSQLFTSGGQSIGVSASASVLPMNIQDWSPLGWTGWLSLQSKGLSRVFSNTTEFFYRGGQFHRLMSRRGMPAILRKRWGFPGIGRLPTFWHLWSTLELSWCLWVCHLACWCVTMGIYWGSAAAAAAKSLQLCLTLCNPRDGSPPGSTIPGILQARTLEWFAISFSKAWKWKVKVKSLSRVRLLATPWTAAYQAPLSLGFSRQKYWSGVPLPSPYWGSRSSKSRLLPHLGPIWF